jgi:hypothetical protein
MSVDKVAAGEDMLRARIGEAAMLSRADRARLVKLMGMLGSNQAGERDAAALTIERLRRERELSWAEILGVRDTRPERR